jgi:metallo-beta-lactamase class B
MILRAGLTALVLAFAAAAPAQSSFAEQRALWNRPLEPFRILGNIHYVGTAHIGAYLVTDGAGHVLIDGGMEESAPQIVANIRRLGFRIEDVRYLLINHAHWDHAGGLAELKRLTNASLVASAADSADLDRGANADRDDLAGFAPVSVDRHIEDGDRLRIGAIELVAHLTPGHTRGCTTWTMRTTEGERRFDVMFACSLTVAGRRLVGPDRYPEAGRDFAATFAELRTVPADVFLSFHDNQFEFEEGRRRRLAGDVLAFVDPVQARRRVDAAEAAFRAEWARQRGAAAAPAATP